MLVIVLVLEQNAGHISNLRLGKCAGEGEAHDWTAGVRLGCWGLIWTNVNTCG